MFYIFHRSALAILRFPLAFSAMSEGFRICRMGCTSKNLLSSYLFAFIFVSSSMFLSSKAASNDTIITSQVLRDGESLISSGEKFELGFFSPEGSTLRYVGIWFYNMSKQAVVWIANRNTPLNDTNGVFTLRSNGSLAVLDGSNNSIWSSTSNSSFESTNSTAVLDDDGNLLLSRIDDVGDDNLAYWQSFTNPTDTYLTKMKVEVNPALGETHVFTSWKSASDPSDGNYTMGIDPRGSPQIVIWDGPKRRWRSGHWTGLMFIGVPDMTANYLYGFKLSDPSPDGSRYFTYTPNSPNILKFRILWNGTEEQLLWDETKDDWTVTQSQPANDCELYNHCGNFGICNINKSIICSCMKGFSPLSDDGWKQGNYSGGCVRDAELQCGKNNDTGVLASGGGDGFWKLNGVKLPDFTDVNKTDSVDTCESLCLNNCSCTAFAYVSSVGCMTWGGDLVDVEQFESGGEILHVRLAASELGTNNKLSKIVIAFIVVGIILLGFSIWLIWRYKDYIKGSSLDCCSKSKLPIYQTSERNDLSSEFSTQPDLIGDDDKGSGPDLPLLNFNCIVVATNNFAIENKLGQGGFGPVYKGKLPGGEEIAVKRLSTRSGQGVEEFKNELTLIAKLQHRNLVRLIGYCIRGEEKILIYEYMPNRSLDCILFDQARKSQLDWRKRFSIIEGIARGLLYLHRDSRLRIIHRDLKASNILLDEEMNPKISDFGMARIFGGNQYEANTNRVVGTYGYMSPEYAMEGLFSVKSDVYSFGVLLIEIVSGKRNFGFCTSEHISLKGYAWHLWSEGKAEELIDPSIKESCSIQEVLRCIHIGMLCVQDNAGLRPDMSSIIRSLESETANLPLPRQPSQASMSLSVDADSFVESREIVMSNDVSVTMTIGR